MDLELIKKLNHFNIYANLGFQFDGIDKIEKCKITVTVENTELQRFLYFLKKCKKWANIGVF